MKKRILKIIGIIIGILLIIIVGVAIWGIVQENKLEKELTKISELVNAENIDLDSVYEVLNQTVTKGDYAKVEKAFKNYLKDNFDTTIKISEILNDEQLLNILTANNYLKDGKDFLVTKAYIEQTRTNLTQYQNDYNEFFTKEKAKSYINKQELDEYYVDLYMEQYVGDIETDSNSDVVDESIDEILNILNIYEEVINLLANNKDEWQIIDENIVFDDTELSNEYEELVNKL